MRKRAASAIIDTTYDLDFTVLTYTCHDPTVHKALGLNTKECRWKVQCRTSTPLDIVCTFDKNLIGRTEVGIKCNDQKVFPVGPSSNKSRLIEDFIQTWPFRGMAKGINEIHFVEVRLYHTGQEMWYPGTVLKQRTDGFFEVMATKQSVAGYLTEELYPFVNKKDLREYSTKKPYTAPERQLHLKVGAKDPLKETTLTADGGEDITRYFGRPTPHAKARAAEGAAPKTLLTVSKDRSLVTGNIGHRELMAYWNGEARAVELIPKRPGKLIGYGSKMWKIMIGTCEHTIEVERRHKISKHVTLLVDGEILVEALAEDIGCYDGWATQFRFVGEPCLEFEVWETDMNGYATNTQGRVEQKKPYSRVCFLNIMDMSNLSTAQLYIDGVEFKELALHQQAHAQGTISISPIAMTSQYHITVPYKVVKGSTSGISGGLNELFGQFGGGFGNNNNNVVNDPYGPERPSGIFNLFASCCGPQVPPPRAETGEWQQGEQSNFTLVDVNPALPR